MAESRNSRRLSRAGLALEKNAVDRDLRVKISAQTPAEDGKRKEIKVDVRDGFVVLSGFVRTFREKERLHRFVMGLRGTYSLLAGLQFADAVTGTPQRGDAITIGLTVGAAF